MRIDNVEVYDLAESIVASGLPMNTDFKWTTFYEDSADLYSKLDYSEVAVKHRRRAERLAQAPANSGHCNFLKGVLVTFNVTGTIKWWEQFQRYHFATIISSQSTMHKITSMDFDKCLSDKVLDSTRDNCKRLVEQYNNGAINFDTLIDNMPLGLMLTARVQTNYLQLRTIYNQRKNHKYHEWKPFCDWIETIPMAKEFIMVEENNVEDN